MAAQGLRVVEDFAVETGSVQAVINVCLDMDETYRPTAASPWTASSTASTPPPTTTAITPSSYSGRNPTMLRSSAPTSRLRNYNPVPVRVGACGDGWHTRNLPIDRIIGGPVFRQPPRRRPAPGCRTGGPRHGAA